MIYIVLGMHKSGTTLISKTLHESGINMGDFDPSIDYYDGQQYEHKELHSILLRMLNSKELHSLDTLPPFDESLIKNYINDVKKIIINSKEKFDVFGFKNPRMVFVYELLKEHLDEHKLIIIYRELDKVISHYAKYKLRYIFKVINAWKLYNEKIYQIIQNSDVDFIVFNYENYIHDITCQKDLGYFIGRKIKNCVRKNKKRKTNRMIDLISIAISFLVIKFNYKQVRKTINNFRGLMNNSKYLSHSIFGKEKL